MAEPDVPRDTGIPDDRPLVVSLCGTYLKKEMQSIYRQITGLRKYRTAVFAEKVSNQELFPFEPVIEMDRRDRPRPRGNFILRFWYKHMVKQWPPPRPIVKEVVGFHPYNLLELLQHHRPDVVHVYYGHKAVKHIWMLMESGIPFVISFHGVDVVKFIEEKFYLEKLRIAFNEAEVVMARSQSLLDRLKDLGCPEEKLRMNRTPIPMEDIVPFERKPPPDGQWRLIQACRLIPKKGIFTVLGALPKVLRKYPSMKYLLAGIGPSREEIAEAVRVRGLSENVEMLGWLDQEKLRKRYEESHIFLHPSQLTQDQDQEGVPNSMLEAMAGGLPVVATYHGGIPEAVTNEGDGLLVPERSPEELGDAILRMMEEPGLLEACSRKAAISSRANFGFDAQIGNLEGLYDEAVELFRQAKRREGEEAGEAKVRRSKAKLLERVRGS
ncbi:MAG: glycosyltransferase [Verrucomicrobiota bacterium]